MSKTQPYSTIPRKVWPANMSGYHADGSNFNKACNPDKLELKLGEAPTNPYSETWYEDLKAFVRLHKPEDAEAIFNNEY